MKSQENYDKLKMETAEQKRKWNATWRANNPEKYAEIKKRTAESIKKFADDNKISTLFVKQYGIKFLRDNPEVIKTLQVIQELKGKGSKASDEAKELRREISRKAAVDKYYQENKDKPEYKKARLEAVNKYSSKEENKEKIKARQKAYKEKNKEKIAAQRALYYLKYKK